MKSKIRVVDIQLYDFIIYSSGRKMSISYTNGYIFYDCLTYNYYEMIDYNDIFYDSSDRIFLGEFFR